MSECQEHAVQRVCVPALLLVCARVHVCERVCVGVVRFVLAFCFFFLWAASICLDIVLNQSVHIWGWEESAMCFIHILFFSFTCCHLSSCLPFRKQYLHTARAVSRLPPSPLRQRVISLCLYPSFLSLPSPSRSLRQAYEHRRSVKKLAVRHIPSLPSPWSPPLLLFHPTACSPLHLPFPSLPPSPILLSLLLPPLCLAPLIHYISSPLLRPLLTPSSFFSCFIICNMI